MTGGFETHTTQPTQPCATDASGRWAAGTQSSVFHMKNLVSYQDIPSLLPMEGQPRSTGLCASSIIWPPPSQHQHRHPSKRNCADASLSQSDGQPLHDHQAYTPLRKDRLRHGPPRGTSTRDRSFSCVSCWSGTTEVPRRKLLVRESTTMSMTTMTASSFRTQNHPRMRLLAHTSHPRQNARARPADTSCAW